MAKRPIFLPVDNPSLVKKVSVEFKWNPGFAPAQKKKNIVALHESAKNKDKELAPLLEISTKSEDSLGQRLSAFKLKIETEIGEITLEAAYQGSKVFENEGPFTDIYKKSSREAKKDARVKEPCKLIGFDFFGEKWDSVPETAFYNWLYLKAAKRLHPDLERLHNYKGFTDIEFNPQKSINCQAYACALLVSLMRRDLLDKALRSQKDFIKITSFNSPSKNYSDKFRQSELAL